MSTTKTKIFIAFLTMLVTADALATLSSRAGGTLVYDSIQDITWIADSDLLKAQVASNPGLVDTLIQTVGTLTDSEGRSHTLEAADFKFASLGLVTWWGARAWAEYLDYGSYRDWRLPTTPATAQAGFNQTDSELGYLFYIGLGGEPSTAIDVKHNSYFDLFTQLAPTNFWSGTEYPWEPAPEPGYAWNFNTRDGYQNWGSLKDNYFHAWAVRSGDVGDVPIPAALGLFSSGLLGLMRVARKSRDRPLSP